MKGLNFNQLKFKVSFGVQWQQLFYHDLNSKLTFETETQILYSPNDELRYSILSMLDDNCKQSDNKFEFLLEYPDRGSSFYFRWKQTNNPLNEREETGKSKAFGFEPIHNATKQNIFAGLVKTVNDNPDNKLSLLNGVPSIIGGNNWNYAVGLYKDAFYYSQNTNKYNYPVSDSQGAEICALWVRLPVSLYSHHMSVLHSYLFHSFFFQYRNNNKNK